MKVTRHKLSFLFDVKESLGDDAYPVIATDGTILNLVRDMLRKVEELWQINRAHGVKYEDLGTVVWLGEIRDEQASKEGKEVEEGAEEG